MSIRLYCGKCGKKFRIRPECAGQRGRCSRCGSFIPIPQSSFDRVLFRLICDACGKGIKSPIENAGKTISCPGCDVKIKLPVLEDDDSHPAEKDDPEPKQKAADPSKTADTKLLVDAARPDVKLEAKPVPPPTESRAHSSVDTFDIELVDEPNHDEKAQDDQERAAVSPKSQDAPKASKSVKQVRVELDDAENKQPRYDLPDKMEKAIDKLEEALAQNRNSVGRQDAHGRARGDIDAPPMRVVPQRPSSGVPQTVILVGGIFTLIALIVLLIVLIIKYNS